MKVVYRQLALQYHPDRNKNPAAWERFKEITQAYADARTRALQNQDCEATDAALNRGFHSPSARQVLDPDLHDGINIFDISPPFPFDSKYVLEITLEEVATGTRKTISTTRRGVCASCKSRSSFCRHCNGIGITEEAQQTSLTIPAGVEHGMQFKLAANGNFASDIFVLILVKLHRIFQRTKDNLYCEVPISATQLRDGTEKTIHTLDGSTATLHVPPGTTKGTIFVLHEKGLPKYGTSRKGNLIAEIV